MHDVVFSLKNIFICISKLPLYVERYVFIPSIQIPELIYNVWTTKHDIRRIYNRAPNTVKCPHNSDMTVLTVLSHDTHTVPHWM